ncbi:hypothetical protein I7I50_04945 [Histoplasma capsulatum G186AR]|uniref:Uncharacterized protein n=1 Tax=Ajellomyces capsulatus TaxID=5037 RepID=A0A8H8D7E0_AJECA|nr:hypothetical protein I7I52_03203 [Histoplasma capsulatum]QSS75719.1 hypothetical protein I7I50_04945 [Histoplasma capsulatum G186AR]
MFFSREDGASLEQTRIQSESFGSLEHFKGPEHPEALKHVRFRRGKCIKGTTGRNSLAHRQAPVANGCFFLSASRRDSIAPWRYFFLSCP